MNQRMFQEDQAARRVIEQFVSELRPDLTRAAIQDVASALIARLASYEPPLFVMFWPEE